MSAEAQAALGEALAESRTALKGALKDAARLRVELDASEARSNQLG